MKRTRIIVCILLVAVLLAAALYFLLPVKLVDADSVLNLRMSVSGESRYLEGEELTKITALREQARARRCFAPAQLYEEDGGLELSLVTDDGPLHIVLGAGSNYMYSSSDDTIWYSIIDGEKLKNDIENALS